MTVIVDGYSVGYSKTGSGPAIVLLHGWGDSMATFDLIVKILQKNYTVITLDLPGFGKSESPKEIFTLKKYAQFVHNFVTKIGETSIFAYIGHSNGGAILIRGLSSGILRSDKLILLASSGVRSDYTARKRFLKAVAKTAKIPASLLPKSTQAKLKKSAYSKIGSDLFTAEHMQDTFRQVVSEDVVHDSAMINTPTLLIYGSHDKSTPAKYGSKFNQQIEQSELVVLDGADHFLHHTHAPRVIKHMTDFLDK